MSLVHTCAALSCHTTAHLQCPTCMKLNIGEGSYFCSQDCFKRSWGAHKANHRSTNDQGTYNPFTHFKYSGSIRAVYPLSPHRPVPDSIPHPDYSETGLPVSEIKNDRSFDIKVLSAAELELVRKACKITHEVLEIAGKAVRPGVTTDEIDRIVHEATVERGAYPSPLNYFQFPKSCCTSVNEVTCHGIPDQRPLEDGDIINIDISCYYHGFHGDANATFLVGNVDDAGRRLVETTRECLNRAIAAVKPGARYRDFGRIIEDYAKEQGYTVSHTFCGHGIHQLFHCAPVIPHYANNKAIGILKPGHVFTIEPIICEGVNEEYEWPDRWTAATKDGKRAAQFEHTLLVTEEGVEILT